MTVDSLLKMKVEEALHFLDTPATGNYGKVLVVVCHKLRMVVDCAVGRRIGYEKRLREIEIDDGKGDSFFAETWDRIMGVEGKLSKVLIRDDDNLEGGGRGVIYFTPNRRQLFLKYLNEVFDENEKERIKVAIRQYMEKYKDRLLPKDIKVGEYAIRAFEADHFPMTRAYHDITPR